MWVFEADPLHSYEAIGPCEAHLPLTPATLRVNEKSKKGIDTKNESGEGLRHYINAVGLGNPKPHQSAPSVEE